jgi:hypothetical protein
MHSIEQPYLAPRYSSTSIVVDLQLYLLNLAKLDCGKFVAAMSYDTRSPLKKNTRDGSSHFFKISARAGK